MTNMEEQEKRKFESNMLDGDKVEDCGHAMLSAKDVWEYISENYQPKPTSDVDSVIKYLTSYGHDKLRCPRCGWVEGKAWHCGLCEGHTQNIIDWYATHLSNKSEKEVSGLEEAK